MKKNLMLRWGNKIALFFLLCTLCVSCSDSESNNPEPVAPPLTATLKYSFTLNGDYLLLADVTVTYKNELGKVVTEPFVTPTWSKELILTESREFGYVVKATAKPNLDKLLVNDKYKLGNSHSNSYYDSKGSGKNSMFDGGTLTIAENSKGTLLEHITRYLSKPEVYHYYKKWDKERETFVELTKWEE